MSNLWKNNRVQFARLLSEIRAIGLTREQYDQLMESMDLPEREYIDEIFERAEIEWQKQKAKV